MVQLFQIRKMTSFGMPSHLLLKYIAHLVICVPVRKRPIYSIAKPRDEYYVKEYVNKTKWLVIICIFNLNENKVIKLESMKYVKEYDSDQSRILVADLS